MCSSGNIPQDTNNLSESDSISAPKIYQLSLGTASAITHQGAVRRTNEDAVLIDACLNLLAVADGMGGHADGALASQMALTSLGNSLHSPVDEDLTLPLGLQARSLPSEDSTTAARLFQAVTLANRQLYEFNQQQGHLSGMGMGTTLTGLWLTPQGRLLGFHVGDTRLYRLRAGQLCQLTHDHSLYQQALDQGALEALPSRNLLWQALGPSARVEPDILSCDWQAGDLFLCCSDGLYAEVSLEAMTRVLTPATPLPLAIICQQLLALALHNGGRDNISIILLHCT